MTMIIHQELCQELRSKSLRGAKQEKLAGLILQAVADFQLTPCKMHIISILFYLAGTDKFKILFFHFTNGFFFIQSIYWKAHSFAYFSSPDIR